MISVKFSKPTIEGEKMNNSLITLLFPLCLGGVFAAVGIGLIIFGLRERTKAKATETWPTANGTILSARLDQQTRTERDQGRTYTRTSYTPIIEYTYVVGGQTYQGSRIFPGASMSYDHGSAQNIVNRYQPGAAVAVHYDLGDPTQAVLETKAKGGNLFLILGGVFAVLGIFGFCIGVVMVFVTQA
jgi:hypothetical protein